jgi:hypothetical protein
VPSELPLNYTSSISLHPSSTNVSIKPSYMTFSQPLDVDKDGPDSEISVQDRRMGG